MLGSEAGSNLRLIDFVYDSTPGLRVIKGLLRNGVDAQDAALHHARPLISAAWRPFLEIRKKKISSIEYWGGAKAGS